jgi:hypothetical protein
VPLQTIPLLVEQNADWGEPYWWFSPGLDPVTGQPNLFYAVPYVFTGTAVKMQVRETEAPTSAVILTLAVGSGITLSTGTFAQGPTLASILAVNGYNMAITNAQTALMPAGKWYYDVLWTSGAKQTYTQGGDFTVKGTATR